MSQTVGILLLGRNRCYSLDFEFVNVYDYALWKCLRLLVKAGLIYILDLYICTCSRVQSNLNIRQSIIAGTFLFNLTQCFITGTLFEMQFVGVPFWHFLTNGCWWQGRDCRYNLTYVRDDNGGTAGLKWSRCSHNLESMAKYNLFCWWWFLWRLITSILIYFIEPCASIRTCLTMDHSSLCWWSVILSVHIVHSIPPQFSPGNMAVTWIGWKDCTGNLNICWCKNHGFCSFV